MEEPPRRSIQIAATVAVWFLATLNLYHLRYADPDLWWYLRCGQDIFDSGAIRQLDTYSFTAAGLPYLNHEWLTQVSFAFVFHHFGPPGLVWLKLTACVAFLVMLDRLLRLHCDDARIRLPLLLLGAHAVGRFAMFRPQTFTFLLFTIVLFLLELDRRQPSKRVWLLPPLLCLWANLHAAFAAGIAVIGFYWLIVPLPKRPSLRLGVVLAVTFVATLVNPFGVGLWEYVVRESVNPLNKQYVDEWLPLLPGPLTWNVGLFLGVVLLTAMCMALARPREWGALILVVFALLGFSARRHVPLFFIVALPWIARWLTDWKRRHEADSTLHLALAALFGAILMPALLTGWFTVTDPVPRIRIDDTHYRGFPFEAVELLHQQPHGGNVWTELEWGGYLIWKLSPGWKVSIDGRNITLYPRAVMLDHFQISSARPPAAALLEHYPVDLVLIHRDRAFAGVLASDRHWERVYEDDVAILFRNRDSTRVPSVSRLPIPTRPKQLILEKN